MSPKIDSDGPVPAKRCILGASFALGTLSYLTHASQGSFGGPLGGPLGDLFEGWTNGCDAKLIIMDPEI